MFILHAVVRAVIEEIGSVQDSIRKMFYNCQKALKLRKTSLLRRSATLDHFGIH